MVIKNNLSVGDQVKTQYDGRGEIVAITKKNKKYIATVELRDGQKIEYHLDDLELSTITPEEEEKLASDYEEAYKAVEKEVAQHLKDADAAIKKAEDVAEKHGAAFNYYFGNIVGYVPKSREEKFGALDSEAMSDIDNIFLMDPHQGWASSQDAC